MPRGSFRSRSTRPPFSTSEPTRRSPSPSSSLRSTRCSPSSTWESLGVTTWGTYERSNRLHPRDGPREATYTHRVDLDPVDRSGGLDGAPGPDDALSVVQDTTGCLCEPRADPPEPHARRLSVGHRAPGVQGGICQ